MTVFTRCAPRGVGAVLSLAMSMLAASVTLAYAQPWPTKPIRLIVNFPAGGTTNLMARAFAPKLAETLGQPVVIDNRGGAAGNIGLEVAAKAPPDGYTLLASSGSPIVVGPHLYKLGVNVDKDLAPIAPLGRILTLLSDQVDFAFDSGLSVPHVKSGKLRVLAVAAAQRSPLFPDTPTMAETGTEVNDALFGVYAPTGTPRDIIARLNREIGRIMQTPDARAVLATFAAEVITLPAGEFAEVQRRDRERYGAFIKAANIRVD